MAAVLEVVPIDRRFWPKGAVAPANLDAVALSGNPLHALKVTQQV